MPMTDTDELERHLIADLTAVADDIIDAKRTTELYRALAGCELHPRDAELEGHLSLSWRRAEDILNGVREGLARPPLTLAQTGGEGEVSDTAAALLRELGWTARPRDTSRHDDQHRDSPPDPPPPDHGERMAPVDPQDARWEERAHAEAEGGGPR